MQTRSCLHGGRVVYEQSNLHNRVSVQSHAQEHSPPDIGYRFVALSGKSRQFQLERISDSLPWLSIIVGLHTAVTLLLCL